MAKSRTETRSRNEKLRDVMTRDPIVLDGRTSIADAARCMRDCDVGDVLVGENGRLRGIVTDRDLVVRCLAEEKTDARLGDICTHELVTLPPEAPVEEAVRLMEQKAVRRIPIVEDERPVGIVSLGDLAIARDRGSALGEVSAAPPNN
jgi:CBS domain-containing protein